MFMAARGILTRRTLTVIKVAFVPETARSDRLRDANPAGGPLSTSSRLHLCNALAACAGGAFLEASVKRPALGPRTRRKSWLVSRRATTESRTRYALGTRVLGYLGASLASVAAVTAGCGSSLEFKCLVRDFEDAFMTSMISAPQLKAQMFTSVAESKLRH